MAKLPMFDLENYGDKISVFPCRRCYERYNVIVKPTFDYIETATQCGCYVVFCPECIRNHIDSTMAEMYSPERLQKRWNDWMQSFDSWEADLDW